MACNFPRVQVPGHWVTAVVFICGIAGLAATSLSDYCTKECWLLISCYLAEFNLLERPCQLFCCISEWSKTWSKFVLHKAALIHFKNQPRNTNHSALTTGCLCRQDRLVNHWFPLEIKTNKLVWRGHWLTLCHAAALQSLRANRVMGTWGLVLLVRRESLSACCDPRVDLLLHKLKT